MKSLKVKFFCAMALLTAILAGLGCRLFVSALRDQILQDTEKDLRAQAFLLSEELGEKGAASFAGRVERLRESWKNRITLVGPSGQVLADTLKQPFDDHSQRPEVLAALKQGEGSSLRYSSSARCPFFYSALKVVVDGEPFVLRLSRPVTALAQAEREASRRFFLLFGGAALCLMAFQLWMVRRFFLPLEALASAAGSLDSRGDVQFPPMADAELQRLSAALSSMSGKLRDSADKIERDRRNLEKLIAALPLGLLVAENGKILRCNGCARRFLDLDRPSPLEPDSVLRLPAEAQALLQNPEPGMRECALNLPERELCLKLESLPIEQGALLLVLDQSESRRLELAKRNFIADAGHEFQTPLTVIGMAAEFLLEDESDPDRRKNIERILQQQKRVTGLVDDLLYLSRLEAGPPDAALEAADLVQIARTALADAKEHPLRGNISIAVNLPQRAPLKAVPDELKTALVNILDNAVKYTRARWKDAPGGQVSFLLERDPSQPNWLVTVEDNGIGIRADRADFLFHRFQRGDCSRSRQQWGSGGYGLGLAIAKRIVEKHRGTIAILPREEGTAIRITLPRM